MTLDRLIVTGHFLAHTVTNVNGKFITYDKNNMVGDRIAWAVWLAARGLPVFPLVPGTKRPLWEGAAYKATTTPAEIEQIWNANPDANIGVAYFLAKRPIVPVDCDGEEGIANWQRICAEHGYTPDTLTIRSAGGGLHYLFEVPDDIDTRNTAGKLADHVDTRGKGGYCAGPGSVTEDGAYTVEHDTAVAPAPEWFVGWLRGEAERRHKAQQKERADSYGGMWNASSDIAHAIARIEYELATNPPLGDKYLRQNADPRCLGLANRILDLPITDAMAVDLLHEHWAPHFDRDWLALKVRNAIASRENAWGCEHHPEASEWLGVHWLEHGQPPPPPKRYKGRSMEELANMPRPVYMDPPHNYLPYYERGALMMVWGPGGAFKTSWLVGKCYETGARMAYCTTESEGLEGLGMRGDAYAEVMGKPRLPIEQFMQFDLPTLGDEPAWRQLADDLREWAPKIVVFDTMHAMSGGQKEDETIGRHFTADGCVAQFVQSLKCLGIVVHHTGWEWEHERGTAALRFAIKASVAALPNRNRDKDKGGERATHVMYDTRRMKDGAGNRTYYMLAASKVGIPVPVECTEAEWMLFAKNNEETKGGRPIRREQIETAIKNNMAFSRDKAVTTVVLARHLIKQGNMSYEEDEKVRHRLARLVEARTEDLGGLYEIDGNGDYQWFSVGTKPKD